MSSTLTQEAPKAAPLVQYNSVRSDIAALKLTNSSLLFLYDTKEGNKNARSHIFKLRQTRTSIEKVRKDAKAYFLEAGRQVDIVAKELDDEVMGMIDVHQKPLDEIQAKKDQLEAECAARVEKLRLEEEAMVKEAADRALAEQKAKNDALQAELDRLRLAQEETQRKLDAIDAERSRAEAVAVREKQMAEVKAAAERQAAIDFEAARIAADLAAANAAIKAKEDQAAAVVKAIADEARRHEEAEAHARVVAQQLCDLEAARLRQADVREQAVKAIAASLEKAAGLRVYVALAVAEAILDGRVDGVTYSNTQLGRGPAAL